MFGQRANSIYFVLSHCDDSASLNEFDDWYDDHLKDMVESTLFFRATRYGLVTNGTCEQHLAIYESSLTGQEVENQISGVVNKLREQGKIPSLAVVTTSLVLEAMNPGVYCFPEETIEELTGILLMANNPKTPGTDSSFNSWYDDVHRLDIQNTGLFATMNRFKSVTDHEIQYVNLYETKLKDVSIALTGLNDFRPKWEEAGTLYADRINTLRGAYQLRSSFPV